MANKFQIKRTSTSGVTPNTTNASNTAYIAPGELAINMADSKLFTANGSGGLLELGSNVTNLSVTNTATIKKLSANGSLGTTGQVLSSNGTGTYWADAGGLTTTNGLDANSTNIFVLANTGIIANTTGTFVNSAYIGTLSANNTTYVNGKTEGNLNVNSATTATTANNATYAYGKTENNLNVNSAGTATIANNASYLGGTAAASYQLNSTLAANVATMTANNATYAFGKSEAGLNVNSAVNATTANNATYAFGKTEINLNVNNATTATTANNATYAFGKTEGAINANSALTANNSTNLNGQAASFYAANSQLANYALLSGATFTGAVSGITTLGAGNTTITGNISVSGNNTINGSAIISNTSSGSATITISTANSSANGGVGTEYLKARIYANQDMGIVSGQRIFFQGAGAAWSTPFSFTTASPFNQAAAAGEHVSITTNDARSNATSNGILSGIHLNYIANTATGASANLMAMAVRARWNESTWSGSANSAMLYGGENGSALVYRVNKNGDIWTVGNLTVGTTAALGNTTIMGFANVTTSVNSAAFTVGTAFVANATQVTLGSGYGFSANGSLGSAGQVLHSNGTSVYWAADDNTDTTYDLASVANTAANAGRLRLTASTLANDDVLFVGAGTTTVSSNATQITINSADQFTGTVTSVASGNGLTGGPITTTGTLSVVANSGLISNSTGVFVNANTELTANSTGVFHNDIARSNTTNGNTSPNYGGTFTAVDSITTNARGHVTAVNTKTVTMPSSNNTTYDLAAAANTVANEGLINLTGSDATTDTTKIIGQDEIVVSSNTTAVYVDHADVTRANNTSSASPASGGTFTAVDSITTNARGHVTAINTKTVTLPVDPNTTYDLATAANTVANEGLINLVGSNAITDTSKIIGQDEIVVSSNTTAVYVDHADVARSNNTSSAAPGAGGTFTAIDSITTNARGHVTAINTKTVTLPADTNTTYDLLGVANNSVGLVRLKDSSNANDDVTFIGTGSASVTSNASHVIINANDTNETYVIKNVANTIANQARIQLLPTDDPTSNTTAVFVGGGTTTVSSNTTALLISSSDQYTGTVTSVTGGAGLTGSVTTSGSLAVGAGVGVTVNADDVAINAQTGLVANATGLYVNSTYIGTLSANNTTYVNGKTEGNLNVNSASTANNADYLDGQHGAYYTNATNITTGTLPEAQLPYRMDQNVRTTDTVTFGNMTVSGNLTVSGTTTTINANNLSIEDNMIYLNAGGANANPDLGWAGNYNDGTYRHAGMFRDASDSGKFKVFDSYTPEPDASPWIDTANATFRIADFQANVITMASANVGGATINSTFYSAQSNTALTANNSTYLNGQLASFYTNATNITAGTLPYAQIPANVINTTANFTISGAHTYTTGANAILFTNATSNWIYWNTSGVGAPAVTTRSAGTKLVLYPAISSTTVDYAIGIDNSTVWFSAADAVGGFKWYSNTTNIMSANTTGLNLNTRAISGVTTLAAGNTTITGFANVTSTIQGGSSLTIAGALSGVTTAAMGNTTITGFANVSTSVNTALFTVGTAYSANSTIVRMASNSVFSQDQSTGTGAISGVLAYNPEGYIASHPFLTNDLANLRLRGGALTVNTNVTLTNTQFDTLFDATPSYTTGFANTTANTILEFTLPSTLFWGSAVGISFGASSWAPSYIAIDAYSNGAWVSCYSNNAFTGSQVHATIPGNAGPGTTALRFTMNANTSTRIAGIWGYDYDSDGWSHAAMPRAGGQFYGNVSVNSTSQFAIGSTTINATSYSGTANNATYFGGYTWAAPGALGTSTANSGAFTTLTASANVNFDSGVLFVDGVNNRVGIGTTAPTVGLQVAGDLLVTSETIGVRTRFLSGKASPANTAGPLYIQYNSSDPVHIGGGTGSSDLYVANGNLGVGTTSPAFTSGSGLEVQRAGTATLRLDSNTFATELRGHTDGTQLYQLSAGYLAFGANNAETARFVSNGNFGIGTTSPAYKLDVVGDIGLKTNATYIYGKMSDGSTINRLLGINSSNTVYIGAIDNTVSSTIINAGGGASPLYIYANNTTVATFAANGNVGVGNTTPSWKLSLNSATQNAMHLYSTGANTTLRLANDQNVNEIRSSSGRLGLYHNVAGTMTEGVALDAAGNVGISTSSPQAKLHVVGTGPQARWDVAAASDGRHEYYRNNAREGYLSWDANNMTLAATQSGGVIVFASGGTTERMRISATGNVGIGTSTPQYELDVNSGAGSANSIQASFGSTISTGFWSGIHFGYSEAANSSYRKSAIVFERQDSSARGKVHILNNDGSSAASATLADSKMTIQYDGNVGIGTTSPGYKLEVNGSFAATTKSFLIDHPTKKGMKLRYGSLEGPENGVYVRGRLKDSNVIELPDYWTGLVDEDTITVNLTAIGKSQDLWVEDIADNKVIIGGENVNCFYTVFAERKDVEKLEVEF